MKHIKVINIVCFALLLCSCKNNENKTADKTLSENIESADIIEPAIESFIKKMIDEEHFIGVVMAVSNNEIIHAKGYGKAQDSIPNNVETKFHVASITKQFTAAAIMQLVEEGKVNLESSINEFLPEKYRSDKWKEVNIHHLLTQTSGIEDYALTRDYYEVEKGFCLGNTVDGMLREAMEKETSFEPGSKFSYSNIGYTLLGQVIEYSTGKTYHRYMQKNVFEPMGMNNSYIHNTSNYSVANDEAIGYRWDTTLVKHVPDDIVSLPVTAPDGNLVTTTADFLKWTRIYSEQDETILKKASIEKMTTPYIEDDFRFMKEHNPHYGFGLSLTSKTISHPGYIVGFRSHFIVDTAQNIKIFVFNNNVSNNPRNVSRGIYEIISVKHIDKKE